MPALTQPSAALADSDNIYGWYECTQGPKLGSSALRVGNSTTYPFPPNAVRDGVDNNFTARTAEAIEALSTSIRVVKPFGAALVSSTSTKDVNVSYRDTGRADRLGVAKLNEHGCYDNGPNIHHLPRGQLGRPVNIDMQIRSDWFTQNNDRRPVWEGCSSTDPSYTCSEDWDYGSAILHELGHAIGIAHPEETDEHIGLGTRTAAIHAACTDPLNYATMCAAAMIGRSGGRVLHTWDVYSLRESVS